MNQSNHIMQGANPCPHFLRLRVKKLWVKVRRKDYLMNTVYDFERAFEEMMDEALNKLSPEAFEKLKDSISMILSDYEE